MRIAALVKSHDHVCCRYRIALFVAALARAGHSLEIHPWSGRWFAQQMLSLRTHEVLIVQRKLLPTWQLRWLRRRVGTLIYDFDDSIFVNSSYNPDGHDSPRRIRQFREMVQCADCVIAGNPFLRDQAAGFTDPAKIHVIPTCLDAQRYQLAPHPSIGSAVQLAWIGSSSTLRGLERVGDLLDRLGKEISGLELKIICDRSLSLQALPVRFTQWSEATEAAELASADIGISWLPDDSWSEGKCGLKLLQYMAAGLPVVANPVGVQRTMVRHGETGFLAETPDEWLNAVHRLAQDPELRRVMGGAARRWVESEYDVSIGAAGWLNVLRSTASVAGMN